MKVTRWRKKFLREYGKGETRWWLGRSLLRGGAECSGMIGTGAEGVAAD